MITTDIPAPAFAAGSDDPGWAWDTALPVDWCDDVAAVTGVWPADEAIVWAYAPRSLFGHPHPLTRSATELLARYERESATRESVAP